MGTFVKVKRVVVVFKNKMPGQTVIYLMFGWLISLWSIKVRNIKERKICLNNLIDKLKKCFLDNEIYYENSVIIQEEINIIGL